MKAKQFAPECSALCELGDLGQQNGSISLNYLSEVEPKLRAAVECCISGMILDGQKENLQRLGNGDILKSFMGECTPLYAQIFLNSRRSIWSKLLILARAGVVRRGQ